MIEVRTTDEFNEWLRDLRDIKGRARILVRIGRIESGNFGDAKPVGGGVSELRLQFGPGYRVYYTMQGETVTILLCGGDKSTQVRDYRAGEEDRKGDRVMGIETKPFDVAEHLDSPEMLAAYLEAVLEEGDTSLLPKALGDVARAIGMANIASGSGIARTALYKALGEEGNPTLETLTKILKAMGLRLTVTPVEEVEA